MEEINSEYALGIDLGTTYSCVSVFRNGAIEIIPNEISERTTPSVITFLENNEIKAGEQTLNYEIKNPKNTIYSIKRLIGKEFNEKMSEEIKKENWPFEVVKSEKNLKPRIKIVLKDEIKYYYPEEISSFILKKLIKSAKEYLGESVNNAVITVPHNFSITQRAATKKAAEMAGINVLRILSEPTAASLAYGLEKKFSKNMPKSKDNINNKYILTFDLGGGTFDISLLEISEVEEDIFDVKATSGDNYLGGDDFDNKLFEYCLEQFCKLYNIEENKIINDKMSVKKLKKQCENAKRSLSSKYETNIYIDEFFDEKDLDIKITRARFENLCNDLFAKLLNHVEKVLNDAQINKSNIKEVVLVGGSTKIPRVKEIISNYFENSKINCEINPDEAVAYGAGILAAKLMHQGGDTINDLVLMDITPLSLGTSVINESTNPKVKSLGNLMDFIIPRGTRIPITLNKNYSTVSDNQKIMDIDIYEGERKYIKDNHLLGKFVIEIPPLPKGEVKIKVCVNIDINGILNISALDKSGIIKGKMKIRNDKELISEEEYNEIMNKNKKIVNKSISKEEKNYKKKIRDYYQFYLEEKDNSYKIKFLIEYNKSIIQFIETFDFNNLNNITVFEKFYLYVKLLFESYQKILILDENNSQNYEEDIKSVAKKYLKLLIRINPYSINELIKLFQNTDDKLLYDIVVFAMKLYYENGIKYLNNQNYNCKNYRARNEFINCIKLKNNFINERRLSLLEDLKKEHDDIIIKAKSNINRIDTSLKLNIELKDNYDNLKLFNNAEYLDKDGILILLGKYREALNNILENDKKNEVEGNNNILNEIEIEAILSANIVKIQYEFLQKNNYDSLKKLAEHSVNLAMSIQKNWDTIPWFKDIKEILEKIRRRNIMNEIIDEEEFEEQMLVEKKEIFEEIEKYSKKDNFTFIKFILDKHPPKRYIKSDKTIEQQWKENKNNLINVLCAKYNQANYPRNTDEEKLKYLIAGKICEHLNNIYHDVNPNQHVCEDE